MSPKQATTLEAGTFTRLPMRRGFDGGLLAAVSLSTQALLAGCTHTLLLTTAPLLHEVVHEVG